MSDIIHPQWNLHSYHFDLPENLIAQHPPPERGKSRMMRLSRENQTCQHDSFENIVECLPANTTLVLNNTRVLPARLRGQRATGGYIEILLIEEHSRGVWAAMMKNARSVKRGELLTFAEGYIQAHARERNAEGLWILEFDDPELFLKRLEQHGEMPLPPYIQRKQPEKTLREQDQTRYQTCFSKNIGAIAAPTAGLHFTPQILEQIRHRGIEVLEVTLHVGRGTFAPLLHEDIRQHPIHTEYFHISPEALTQLTESMRNHRKIVAVGTTSVRVLETLALHEFKKNEGWTNIYIYPPYTFKVVQGMLTNFHLPESTLILLVSAFYGKDELLLAYQQAIAEHYRFYSYGDCMLIL
ncbi:MAG: tRNA preQ1(34) S-adenosylmethionine ribosyltransferase-isomerase QueA [SAR324 cluster bacterium]|nr:tRNA preQ1(34) S-adenosylmethionine ribosyltransferase-isomerase QueA [SAR324 cluster bacterium]